MTTRYPTDVIGNSDLRMQSCNSDSAVLHMNEEDSG